MKKNTVFILIAILLTCNIAVFATESITAELSSERAKVGDCVSISGITNPEEWVSIKIIDEMKNIIYFNAVTADQAGVYKDTFTVSSISPGTVTVIAGSGSNTTSIDLEIYRSSTSSDDNEQEANDDGSITVNVPKPDLDKETGEAKVGVTSKDLEDAFNKAGTNKEGKKKVELKIPAIEDARSYQVELPKSALETAKEREIEITTDIGTVTLPGNMLGNNATGQSENISLNMKLVDKTGLSSRLQKKIGNKPVIQLQLIEDGEVIQWKNRKAPVTVSLPYTPTEEEKKELKNTEKIAVWYIDGEGNIIKVKNGRYNAETGRVEFEVKHFSIYAVVYDEVIFNDLDNYEWAKHQIEVLAAKGIINGTGNNNYSPSDPITRAEFLTLLIRTLELEEDFENNFLDVDTQAYYYQEIGTAKALDITLGDGQNRFNPDDYITRQDMMVLTGRTLELQGLIDRTSNLTNLNAFSDINLASSYALESMALLVENQLITGSGSKINPLGNTTRAEAAVLLYRIYNRQ